MRPSSVRSRRHVWSRSDQADLLERHRHLPLCGAAGVWRVPLVEGAGLGVIPLTRGPNDSSAAKGEAMRYLAELAWTPDALLHNRTLEWDIVDERRLAVRHGRGEYRAEVELLLDDQDRIGAIFASDRPRYESSHFIERPWHGRFFDYRQHAGRWLLFQAEVAWEIDDCKVTVWRGEIIGWQLGWSCTEPHSPNVGPGANSPRREARICPPDRQQPNCPHARSDTDIRGRTQRAIHPSRPDVEMIISG